MCVIEPRLWNAPAVIPHNWPRSALIAGLLFTATLFTGVSFAEGTGDPHGTNDRRYPERIDYRFDNEMPARDGELNGRIMYYFGQTKLGGSWELGLVIDRGDDGFDADFRGLAIIKRF